TSLGRDHVLQPLERVPGLGEGQLEVRIHDGEEEAGLAVEVGVDRALGEPGEAGDLIERRGVVADVGEHRARGEHERLARLTLSLATGDRIGQDGHRSMVSTSTLDVPTVSEYLQYCHTISI